MRAKLATFINKPSKKLTTLLLSHIALTTWLALNRHYAFKSNLFDHGVIAQVLWRFWHEARPYSSIIPPYTDYNWLGFHFSPILLLFSPLYAAFPAPETLYLLQSTAIALTAIPIYAACHTLNASPRASLTFAAIALFNPFALNAAIWDIHEVAFAAPLLAAATWALLARRLHWMLFFSLLLLATKEHYGLAVAGLGLAWGWRHRQWRIAAPIALFGAAACAFIILKLMPSLSGLSSHPMMQNSTHFPWQRFDWLTLPWNEAIPRIFTIIFSPLNATYGALLFIPFLGFPLLAPSLLLPLAADLAANAASGEIMQKSIFAYHSVAMIPILTIAACAGHQRWITRRREPAKPALIGMLIATLGLAYMTSPFPGGRNIWELNLLAFHRPDMTTIEALIASDDRISIQADLGAYLSHHSNLRAFPEGLDSATLTILNLNYPYRIPNGPYGAPYGLTDRNGYCQALQQLLQSNDWGLLWQEGDIIMLRRGLPTYHQKQLQSRALKPCGKHFQRSKTDSSISGSTSIQCQ